MTDFLLHALIASGETADYSTGEPIFPHLSGGAVPAVLPFGVRVLD